MASDQSRLNLDQDVLRELVSGTASAIGEEFFDTLVEHLARAIGTKCAWVTEWFPSERRLCALSFWADNRHVPDYIYNVSGTPCETVVEGGDLLHVPDRVMELYPTDPDLKPLGAVSYMGIPLRDTGGQVLGHLAVMHDKPLPEDPRATAIFNIFAGRAAAELRRLRRDRDLRERELKMSRLINSAKDSIIELDSELSITRLNRAAERVFGCKEGNVIGHRFDSFLTPESYQRLTEFIRELAQRPDDERSLWITEGMEALGVDGATFPAEATISSYDLNRRSYYTLILRNVNELLQAEEEIRSLRDETAYLRTQIEALRGSDEILGDSQALRAILADVERVAKNNTTVLIFGETGTGKELIARAIHQHSPRADKPLIKVNCAAIAANLQESEFFGHERGAFTGATQRRVGRFKLADGGTIFLDEVGEMPLDLQAKLLRVLQEGEYEPVGSSHTEKINVRVIAATNRDLEKMVKEGGFRRDLLYRLNVFPIHMPPLRERGDDIILLAETFLRRFVKRGHRSAMRLTEDCKVKLKAYDWPGNIRELENVIERAVITSKDGRTLNLDRALPNVGSGSVQPPVSTEQHPVPERILTATEMNELERKNILRALEAAHWKVSGSDGAAERLGLHPSTLSSRMRALGISRPR
jgi:PAS domain S-box-containing protein